MIDSEWAKYEHNVRSYADYKLVKLLLQKIYTNDARIVKSKIAYNSHTVAWCHCDGWYT